MSASSFTPSAGAAMSYADTDVRVAPAPAPVADPVAQPAIRQPLRRRRLDLIYFALAAIDLVTILLTLFLSNHLMTLYQRSVARSAFWSARVGELVELAQFAQATNAPGNDVFDSHDAALERTRRDAALQRYERQREMILADFAAGIVSEGEVRVADRMRAADRHMAEMVREGDRIFAEIDAGRHGDAGRRMATMDRIYARLSRTLLDAIIQVQLTEDMHLVRQAELAEQLRKLELIIMGAIILIILGVVLYGRRIGRVMRATEDAHNEMLQELAVANESLQQYADNVAHELRSPVNKMLLASELALTGNNTPAEYQDALVGIIEECRRLAATVGSLLFLARARQTRVQVERQTIDVGTELGIICTYFEAPALEAGIKLTCTVSEDMTLRADRTLFQRAVGNLVANAIAHTAETGQIAVSAVRAENVVRVEVRDDGEGMSADVQSRVFERFFRVDSARTSTSGRIGLGLSITKSILELHGGVVRLESSPGAGTRVQLDFPL